MKKFTFLMRFLTKSILLLPGTFAHELMHLLVATITGSRITSFSLIPKLTIMKNGKYNAEFGSVGFRPKIKAFNFLVGLAPLLLWAVIGGVLYKVNILSYSEEQGVMIDFNKFFDIASFWIWVLIIELGWGSLPSSVDIKTSLKGFFSISGLILIGIIGVAIYVKVMGHSLPF